MLPVKYWKNPSTTSPLATHFYCSPAKHLSGSFPSLFVWELGTGWKSHVMKQIAPPRENRMPFALTAAKLWPQKDLLPQESPWRCNPPCHTVFPVDPSSFTGRSSSSVSCERKEDVIPNPISHVPCEMWKLLCQAQCFPLDSVAGSAELEVNVFWCSLRE